MATKFGVRNLIKTATANSQNTFYPASNLLLNPTYKEYRNTTNTANIVFDCEQPQPADTLFLCGNNGTSVLALTSFVLKANPVDSGWNTPAFSVSHTVTADEQENGIVFKEFATQSFRFWRIEVENVGDSYVGLSNIFIGSSSTIDIAIGYSFSRESLSNVSQGRYGQKFIDKVNTVKVFDCEVTAMNEVEKQVLDDIVDYADIDTPIWINLDTTDDNLEVAYVQFEENPTMENLAYRLYSTSFTLREVV